MPRALPTLLLIGLLAGPVEAQRRGDWYGSGAQGIPPGHLPPPGTCRVWYDGRPPGRQPGPTSCRDAERAASRNRSARVIYGAGRYGGTAGWGTGPGDNYGWRGAYGYQRLPFDNGFRDGYEKGREDARDLDAYDPIRHGRYRSADRGYDRRYGPKDDYKHVYRQGFRDGYDEGYREHYRYGRYEPGRDRRSIWVPWPF